MSYLKQAEIEADPKILIRLRACAAAEKVPTPGQWVQERTWQFATQPGWVDAYAASNSDEPGADEDAITDAMILEAVQSLNSEN